MYCTNSMHRPLLPLWICLACDALNLRLDGMRLDGMRLDGMRLDGQWYPSIASAILSSAFSPLLPRPFTYPEGFTYSLVSERASAFEKPEGLLEVTVIEATNVPRMDLLGKASRRGVGALG